MENPYKMNFTRSTVGHLGQRGLTKFEANVYACIVGDKKTLLPQYKSKVTWWYKILSVTELKTIFFLLVLI